MRFLATAALVLALVPAVLFAPSSDACAQEDPLEAELDRSGLSDSALSARSEDGPRIFDAELTLVSDPAGLGLRSTRRLEAGTGVERTHCHAPCVAYLEHGSYTLAVETRRGRRRAVSGVFSFSFDGTLVLGIHSRRGARTAWWIASAAMIGSGLSLYLTHRHAQFKDDPFCVTNCTYYTTSQRVAMTAGGLITMFGGIGIRYAIATRDTGIVHYQPSRTSHHVDPDEAVAE